MERVGLRKTMATSELWQAADWEPRFLTSRFFSRTFLAEFSLISEVRSFSLLACILEQECRKYLGINLRKYLYFSQG